MSIKAQATSEFRNTAKAVGGAHLTVVARISTAERFVESIHSKGFQIASAAAVGGRHIASFIEERKADGASLRTMQNEMSHLRCMLRDVGREGLADHISISNKELGISGACRAGTKAAATDAQYRTAVATAGRYDPGVAAALQLQRTLGLRSQEAITSGPTLRIWEKQIASAGHVHVAHGTKGGRERFAVVPDRAAALDAVRNARIVAKANGGNLLPGTLKQASERFGNVMSNHVSIQSHSLRYSYAQDLMAKYRAEGYDEKTVLALTSISLGHGDRRGRYVGQVYSLSGSESDED